jgi:hypothetical protein
LSSSSASAGFSRAHPSHSPGPASTNSRGFRIALAHRACGGAQLRRPRTGPARAMLRGSQKKRASPASCPMRQAQEAQGSKRARVGSVVVHARAALNDLAGRVHGL